MAQRALGLMPGLGGTRAGFFFFYTLSLGELTFTLSYIYLCCTFCLFCDRVLQVIWAELKLAVLLSQPPRVLGLQMWATMPSQSAVWVVGGEIS